MIDLSPYFGSLAAVAGLVVFLTGWLNTNIFKLTGWKTQILSWVISAVLTAVGTWQKIGLFAETDLLWAIVNGLGIGLVANGIYSAEFVKNAMDVVNKVLKIKLPAKN